MIFINVYGFALIAFGSVLDIIMNYLVTLAYDVRDFMEERQPGLWGVINGTVLVGFVSAFFLRLKEPSNHATVIDSYRDKTPTPGLSVNTATLLFTGEKPIDRYLRQTPKLSYNSLIVIMTTLCILYVIPVIVDDNRNQYINDDAIASESTPQLKKAGWGPDRDIYSIESPGSFAVFNSTFDHPHLGDERNFTKAYSESRKSILSDYITVKPGESYTVRTNFRNDGEVSSSSTANYVTVRSQVPESFTGSARITSLISSSDARPNTVWDGVVFRLADPKQSAALRYIPGSAKITVGSSTRGIDVDDLFSSDGAAIGCEENDGIVKAGDDCAGYIEYKIKIVQPDFTVEVETKNPKHQDNFDSFSDARPGDKVDVRLLYRNVGSVRQDNVVIKITNLPQELRYISNSTAYANSRTSSKYKSIKDDIVRDGINAGNYSPGEDVYVIFSVQVRETSESIPYDISQNDFAKVVTDNGNKSAPIFIGVVR